MTASERRTMRALTGRLVTEYAGALPPGSVIRCVARCRAELARAGVRDGLLPATEAMARTRLNHRLVSASAVA